jgi:acyl-CoA thioester hydrolase
MDRCDLEIRVRYAETDRMGYVHHSRYFVYFEMGRTELLRQGGIAYRDLEDAGVFFVIAKAACRFVSPGRYDDVLVLTTKLERMTTARVDHVYELKRQGTGELICTAETTLACVGRDGRPIAIPDNIRGSMEA